jgi:hypothetical protein
MQQATALNSEKKKKKKKKKKKIVQPENSLPILNQF